MAISERRTVTVLLTEEHLRGMIEDHLLKEDEIGDRVKVARIVQKLLDTGLGLPDRCRPECGWNWRGIICSNVTLSDHAARSIG